jgi:AcrR family transcriptional regulator
MKKINHYGGSREAIVKAAQRLFLGHDFASVSIDDLAESAGVARRTLYNQFSSKEKIFREMLLTVSHELGNVLPPGIETQGDVEDVLRLTARAILAFQRPLEYVGLVRTVVADAHKIPWLANEFEAVLHPWPPPPVLSFPLVVWSREWHRPVGPTLSSPRRGRAVGPGGVLRRVRGSGLLLRAG